MTAGQSAGQLRRTDPSGIYLVIAAVVAGALAVAILATLMVEHPAAKAPAAAPIPVAPAQFRLEEHGSAIPAAVPAPSIQFRLEEHGQAVPLSPDDWARTHTVAPLSPDELERNLFVAGGAAAGSATASQEARARAQMVAAGTATAIPAPSIQFRLEEHGQTVLVNAEAWARAQMAAASATSIPAPSIQFRLEEHGVAVPSTSTSTHPHGKLVRPAAPAAKSTNSYSRWGMNAQ